jgi:hypothetical protein
MGRATPRSLFCMRKWQRKKVMFILQPATWLKYFVHYAQDGNLLGL